MGKYITIAAANSFDRWPAGLRQELQDNAMNPVVGSVLVSETDKLRVWHLLVPAGERCTFHRHVLDYFWTAISGGRGRQHMQDGTTFECTYEPGETRHEAYGAGEFKVHDLQKLSDGEMVFMTVEFKDSANKPLQLPAHIRPSAAA